jgi:hypothetical protein
MEISPLTPNQSIGPLLFDSYIIKELPSFDALLNVYQQFRQDHPEQSVIVTLDDLGQAEYTSTHATMMHDLDNTEGYDLSGIDASAFENGEHIGYLSTPSEFFIQKENFMQKITDIGFSDACERGLTIEPSEIQVLEKIKKSPLDYLDKHILVKIVPVSKSYEAICGFPNGYFSSDLDPFENYAVAKHLYDNYGYEFFGIGASLLGFIRNRPLEEQEAAALVTDLIALYNSDESIYGSLLALVKDSNYLILKYTEYLN